MGANLSKVFSAELDGIEARLVEVETDIHVGLHAFNIVGLADKALSEAKERVSSALKNIGIKAPTKENRKIVVNLAPADLKKTGSQYDAAIAIGYLLATRQIKEFNASDKLFVGELALDSSLRPINGALNITFLAQKAGFKFIFVPEKNAQEAALVKSINVIPVKDLKQLIKHLEGEAIILPHPPVSRPNFQPLTSRLSLSDIKGQENAKRALLIAAAGGHNLLMVGPPGGGKTMLAQAFVSLLPPLSLDELIEVTQIYSASGLLKDEPFIQSRPFRNPHHGASAAAVIGGGSVPRPGEISLAHRGVLFLDELPEFRRDVLEALRQPLESGRLTVARTRGTLSLPANFTLIAAMNPCPCGYKDDDQKECTCTANEAARYQKKISGPLLDRIDMQINVPRVELQELREKGGQDQEDEFKNKVLRVKQIRQGRGSEFQTKLTQNAERLLEKMFKDLLVTARGYYKVLRIAQTIADLEESPIVTAGHLQEAFSYRTREK